MGFFVSRIRKHTDCVNNDIDLNLYFYRFVNNNKDFNQCQKIILCKLYSWLSKKDNKYGFSYDDKQWVRNSYSSWQKKIEIFSKSTIRRALSKLEQDKLISSRTFEEGKKFCGGEQVKYFTLNFGIIENFLNTSKCLAINAHKAPKKSRGDVQNDHPHLSHKISTLKKTLKKKLSPSNSQSAQQDRKLKNIFSSDQIQKIISMKQIWNELVEGKGDKFVLDQISKREQAYLLKALVQYFSNDVDLWKIFCTKITTSSFLMGEKTYFKVSLSWILRFANLQKVMDGNLYGLGDRSPKPFKNIVHSQESSLVCDLNNDILMDGFVQESMIQEALNIRQKILQRVGEGAYISWFSKARLVLNDHKKYVLYVENSFIKNSIQNRFDIHLKGLTDDVCLMSKNISSVQHLFALDKSEMVEDFHTLLGQNKDLKEDSFLREEATMSQIDKETFEKKIDLSFVSKDEKPFLCKLIHNNNNHKEWFLNYRFVNQKNKINLNSLVYDDEGLIEFSSREDDLLNNVYHPPGKLKEKAKKFLGLFFATRKRNLAIN